MSDYDLSEPVYDDSSTVIGPINPTTVHCTYDDAYKETLTSLSEVPQGLRPHMMSVNPLPGIEQTFPQVQQYLSEYAARDDLRYAAMLDLDDDSPFETKGNVQDMVNHFGRVLRHDFTPIYTKEKQSAISKAYVAPLLGFLDAELPHLPPVIKVAIIGAGPGKDIPRVMKRVVGKAAFVCVEPNRHHCKHISKHYPFALVINSTAGDSVNHLEQNGPYDLIIANMSFHYIMGVESADRLVRAIDNCLKPTGIMFGSYVDTYSVKGAGSAHNARTGHSVTYIGEDKDHLIYGERSTHGVASISVAGTIWQDPIIDQFHLMKLVQSTTLCVNVFDGHTVLFGPENKSPIYKAPEKLTQSINRPELKFYRMALISKSFRPDKVDVGIPQSLVTDKQYGPSEVAQVIGYNKGKLLQPWELQFLDPALVVVSEKKDGIMAKLLCSNGSFSVVVGDHQSPAFKCLKFPNLSTNCKDDFVLQVEMVPVKEGDWCDHEFYHDNVMYHIIAVDVLKHPTGVIGSFMNRWTWLQRMYKLYKAQRVTHVEGKTVLVDCTWPFYLQQYFRLDTYEAFEMINEAHEGIVVQPVNAPAGVIKEGAGSARYVKRVITQDIIGAGGIIEVNYQTGAYIRDRPDKKHPNPKIVVDTFRTAVKYDEFRAYAFAKVVGVAGADLQRIVRYVAGGIPLGKWLTPDLVWAYFNRGSGVFRALLPNASAFLETAFVSYCSKQAMLEATLPPPVDFEAEGMVFADDLREAKKTGASLPEPLPKIPPSPASQLVVPTLDLTLPLFKDIDETNWSVSLSDIVQQLRERGHRLD